MKKKKRAEENKLRDDKREDKKRKIAEKEKQQDDKREDRDQSFCDGAATSAAGMLLHMSQENKPKLRSYNTKSRGPRGPDQKKRKERQPKKKER